MKLKVTPEMFAAMQELVDEGYLGAAAFDIPELLHDWRVLSQRVAFLEARNAELENAIRIVHERYGETYTRSTSGNCCPNAMRELHEVLNKK